MVRYYSDKKNKNKNIFTALDVCLFVWGLKTSELVVDVILAVGVALLQGRGRGARGRGAGGFDPGLGEQGGGDGGGGRHGDLDDLVALDQPDESFEAFQRRLSVSLLPQQSLSQVRTLFERHLELLVFFFQMSALFLQLVVSSQQPSLLLLPHRLVCNVGLNKVLWPRHVLLVQNLLLTLGAVPGASGRGFERRVEAVGVEGSGAVVAGLQLAVLLTDGTVVVMLQVLLPAEILRVSCRQEERTVEIM